MLLFKMNINLIAVLFLICSFFAAIEKSHALGSKPGPQPKLYYPDANVTWDCSGMGIAEPFEGSTNVKFDPNRGFYASDDYTGINLGSRPDGSEFILVTHFSRKSSSEVKIERLDAIVVGPSNQPVYSTANFTVANSETISGPAAGYAVSVIDSIDFTSCVLTFEVEAPTSSTPLNR